MATVREIKGRTLSVQNIQKITETMEKISTAKISRMTLKFRRAQVYCEGLKEILFELLRSLEEEQDSLDLSYLQKKRSTENQVLILSLSSNRGLCGSYNNNILTQTKQLYHQYQEQGKQVRLHLIGKKAIKHFQYMKIPFEKGITDIDDRISYETIETVFGEIQELYTEGKVDQVDLVYTHYESPARQRVQIETLLPISYRDESSGSQKGDGVNDSKENSSKPPTNYIFEPDKKSLLELLPFLFLKAKVFQDILGGLLSENIARRISMKQASDSAGDMIQELKKEYNHVRQDKITKELIEIMGAVKALTS